MKPVELAYQMGYRCDVSGVVRGPRGNVMAVHGKYPRFRFKANGATKHVQSHRLQAYQKFGAAIFDPEIHVRHLDGNSANASYGNLALGSRSQNEMDKPREVRVRSAKIAASFVTKHDHAAVIASYNTLGFKNTLDKFGIGKSTLSFILRKSATAKQLEAA